MPLSADPEKRNAQLANLRKSEGAVKHGATSERKLAPLRAKHRADLLTRFPRIDEHRLRLLSDLLARIDLAGEFVDVNGLMRNTRETHPVLELLTRWERRAWDMLSQLAPKGPAGSDWNRDTPELEFELTAAEQIGLRAADLKTQADTANAILRRVSGERARGRATSLRHSSLNMRADRRPAKKISFRDLTPSDLAFLDELGTKAETDRTADAQWDLKKLTDEQLATLEKLAAIATAP